MLLKESGKFVTACFGSDFTFSLQTENIDLAEGSYWVMVDPIWPKQTVLNPEYKKVLIDVYAS